MNESQLIENEIIINEELKNISPEPSLEWINKKIKEQICNDNALRYHCQGECKSKISKIQSGE